MKKHSLFLLSVLLLGGTASISSAAPAQYTADVVHSNVFFKVRHNDISYVFGRFNDFEADIRWDEENAANSQVSFVIKTESVDTRNERRDNHLRSPDFFNARQFPEIAFTSNEIEKTGDDTFQVSGDVTLLGKTQPVSFTWTETGTGTGARGEFRRGGIATFTVDRTAFGMDFMTDRLSKEIEVTISLQTIRQD